MGAHLRYACVIVLSQADVGMGAAAAGCMLETLTSLWTWRQKYVPGYGTGDGAGQGVPTSIGYAISIPTVCARTAIDAVYHMWRIYGRSQQRKLSLRDCNGSQNRNLLMRMVSLLQDYLPDGNQLLTQLVDCSITLIALWVFRAGRRLRDGRSCLGLDMGRSPGTEH